MVGKKACLPTLPGLYANANPNKYIDSTGENFVIPFPHPVAIGVGIIVTGCIAINCTENLANLAENIVDKVSDFCKFDADDAKPSKAACNKAKKLLEDVIRLAEKLGKNLPDSRKKELTDKINNGTITSDDLPGSIQDEFPSEFKGKSLAEIEKICK